MSIKQIVFSPDTPALGLVESMLSISPGDFMYTVSLNLHEHYFDCASRNQVLDPFLLQTLPVMDKVDLPELSKVCVLGAQVLYEVNIIKNVPQGNKNVPQGNAGNICLSASNIQEDQCKTADQRLLYS